MVARLVITVGYARQANLLTPLCVTKNGPLYPEIHCI